MSDFADDNFPLISLCKACEIIYDKYNIIISKRHLKYLCTAGKIMWVKPGMQYLVYREHLEKILDVSLEKKVIGTRGRPRKNQIYCK